MRYYYWKQDLFDGQWVECDMFKYMALQKHGVDVKKETGNTPLKDALLDELRDSAPAVVSLLADALVEESDIEEALTVSDEELNYFIDEELINPDYDDEEFSDGEELTSESHFTIPVDSSSTNTNKWFPNAEIVLPDGSKADKNDIKRVQAAVYTLLESGMVHDSGVLDGGKFVKRLETIRDVRTNTAKLDRANPSILMLPDFSPSCASYAKLYSTLLEGVSTIRDEFNVVCAPTFNGLPKQFIVNGVRDKEPMQYFGSDHVDDDCSCGSVSQRPAAQKFYGDVLGKWCARLNITTIIIAGDMDGTWCYELLGVNNQIERMIWVDGSYWNGDTAMKDRTSELLYKLQWSSAHRKIVKSKLTYWSGVKNVSCFVRAIERSNSW